MLSPKKYTGYDKDNKVVGSQVGEDANKYINPSEIKAATKKVEAAFEKGIKSISKELTSVTDDAANAIVVQGTSMGPVIEETAKNIGSIPAGISSAMAEINSAAEEKHDELQKDFNAKAKKYVSGLSGVVRVE